MYYNYSMSAVEALSAPFAPGLLLEREVVSTPVLSVVMPAYNEADRIQRPIEDLLHTLDTEFSRNDYELVVVSDGSEDDTAAIALEAGASSVIAYETNQGKGHAVKTGLLAASGSARLFCDADGAFTPTAVIQMGERVINGEADIAIAQRNNAGHESMLRKTGSHILGRLFEKMMPTGVDDTQCGLKAFNKLAVDLAIAPAVSTGFAFDREVLSRARASGLTIQSVGVEVTPIPGSTVRPLHDARRMFHELQQVRSQIR